MYEITSTQKKKCKIDRQSLKRKEFSVMILYIAYIEYIFILHKK